MEKLFAPYFLRDRVNKLVGEDRNLLRIIKHLEDVEARERVRRNIQRGRNEVTVTIGKAAKLFGFSESQLRDWERIGLLKPMRPKEGESGGRQVAASAGHSGQRQYSFSELDKLAIIRELIDEAKLTPGIIPPDIDELWRALTSTEEKQAHSIRNVEDEQTPRNPASAGSKYENINRRVTSAYRDDLCWRFYASRVLLLSLLMVYEEVPGSYAGLILPSNTIDLDEGSIDSYKLPLVGEALVGWLGQTRSFYTFLATEPAFEYPSDYTILPLCSPEIRKELEPCIADRTLVVVQREDVRNVQNNNEKVVKTVRRLLEPLYEDRSEWPHYFGEGMRDIVNPGMDLTPKISDAVLTGLANIVIRLGGKKWNEEGQQEDRWQACCILLPDNLLLPLQQRRLIVRAKSDQAKHVVGVTTATPERYGTSLSLRAYQSGHIMYRPELSNEDITVLMRDIEGPIKSNIAIPIGGENGHSVGVLYVSSYDRAAFTQDDQRVLRIIARLIDELLSTYSIQQQITEKLNILLEDPETIDASFKEFPSENEFMQDLEQLLQTIQKRMEEKQDSDETGINNQLQEVSFIAIDVDTDVQESVATSYGDQTLRNLNRALGYRIRDAIPTLSTNYMNCKLYHIYAGRFYLFLRGFPLKDTNRNAESLRLMLRGNIPVKQSELPSSTLFVPDVTVHLGVTWYEYTKLEKLLYPRTMRSVNDVSSTLYHALDFVLRMGAGSKGGDVVYTWNPETQTVILYDTTNEQN